MRLQGVIAAALFMPTLCLAQASMGEPSPPPYVQTSRWELSATGYFYNRSDSFFAIATADRDALHLETRYNYEALDSGSLFVGWTFSGGDAMTWKLRPILGTVFGSTQGVAPGLEASMAYGIVDFYTETEYMHNFNTHEDSFTYAWSELGLRPLPWLRFGLVGERSKVYKSDRDIQRGGFAQFTMGRVTLGTYVFNPDDSANQFVILTLGASF